MRSVREDGDCHNGVDPVTANAEKTGAVQSIARTFGLLEVMTELGGIVTLSDLQHHSGLPLPTIHRLLQTLVALGYVRQDHARRYALGPRLTRLGEGASRLIATWAVPHLRHLVEELGESANLAMLDGEKVLYVAHSPGLRSMRMFTEVGRRAGAHCTAVGKVMLAQLSDEEVITLLGRSGMPALTQRTITTLSEMLTELRTVRADGFALDNGEQEEGVRCVAVALPGSPARAALSISAPSGRMTDSVVREALPLLRHEAASLAEELDLPPGPHGASDGAVHGDS